MTPSRGLQPCDEKKEHIPARIVGVGFPAAKRPWGDETSASLARTTWVLEPAGYDNFLVEFCETQKRSIVHSSFIHH